MCAAAQKIHIPVEFCWYQMSIGTGWLNESGTGWLQVVGTDWYRFTLVYLIVTVWQWFHHFTYISGW
jgi:hypothetical protein